MTRALFIILPALVAFSTGCSENDFHSITDPSAAPAPDIDVTPMHLRFSSLKRDASETQTFDVINVGETALTVHDMFIDGTESFSLLTPMNGEFMLEPGKSRRFEVAFRPLEAQENIGEVVILSDDPDEPETSVGLEGFGEVPQLVIGPNPMDLGNVEIPCDRVQTVTLQNIGVEELVIKQLDFKSFNGSLAMIDSNVLPLTLGQYDKTTVDIRFAPVDLGNSEGELLVTSNDPRGIVTARQRGMGVYAADSLDTFSGPPVLEDDFVVPAQANDNWTVPTEPPVDILFAVDQSCSMDDQTAALGQAFGDFIGTINNVTTGWNIGVVTNDNGCFNSGTLDAGIGSYQSLFQNAVATGGCGGGYPSCDTEALLKLTDTALSKTGSGQCNAGFLRPGALLHVIVVSDEEEQSGANPSYWVNRFENHVSHPSLLKVSAIADINKTCGDYSGAQNYKDAANLTGGEILNVCTSAWSSQTANLALASLSAINEYTLSTQAEPGTIEVYVNGNRWTSGWSYNANTNAVTFTNSPPEGANLNIDYLPRGANGTFTLSSAADPSTIQVKVNGQNTNTGWVYDSSTREVSFVISLTPGALVEVSYINNGAGTDFPLSGNNVDEQSIQVFVNGSEITNGWNYNTTTNTVEFDQRVNSNANIQISYGEFGEC